VNTGRPVFTIEQDVEAAMGAALLAAIAAGVVSPDEVRRGWVTLAPRATPSSNAGHVYDRLYESYKALYPALKATMHELAEQAADARGVVGPAPESTHARSAP
jgi:ribulokinase